jgi:hypothetical protein
MKKITKLIRKPKLPVLALFLTIVVSVGYAQDSEVRNLKSFDGVKVSGPITLYLKQGNTESVRVETDGVELDLVITEVENNALNVRMKSEIKNRDFDVKVYVTYKKVRDLRSTASARLLGQSVISGDKLTVTVSTSGSADLEVNLNTIEMNALSAGELTISGKVESQESTVNTAGKLYAFKLICDNAYMKIGTGGVAEILATKLLEGSVKTGGKITYKGNPAKERITKSTGGSISEITD